MAKGQEDPYTQPNGVLANKFNATSTEQLNTLEARVSYARELELIDNPIRGKFDLDHLNRLHKHLFQDVYSWAGQPRTVDIGKGGDTFAHHAHVEKYTEKLLSGLARENHLQGSTPERFAERAGHYMGELLAVHPYREGNGRTTRAFVNELARESGYWVEWKAIGRQAMISASRQAFDGDSSGLSKLIKLNLRTPEQGASLGMRNATPSVNISVELFKESQSLNAAGESGAAADLHRKATALAADIGKSGRYTTNPFPEKSLPELHQQFDRGAREAQKTIRKTFDKNEPEI